MDLSGAARLEASNRIQERAFGDSGEDRRPRTPSRRRDNPSTAEDILTEEESEGHELDDLA
jgi:hypothetical protein